MNPSLSDYREFLAGVKNHVLDARIQARRAINREVVDINQLNAELKTTVAKIDRLRADIDAIVAKIDGGEA